MKVKIARSGDELLLPLPEEFIARYQLKEGNYLDGKAFVEELERAGYGPPDGESDTRE